MDTGFGGRKKKVTGKADIHTTGAPVSTGKPAGKDVSYSKRKESAQNAPRPNQQGSAQTRSVTRGLGGGKLIIIVILAALLLGGGGLSGLFGNLFGGGSTGGSQQTSGGLLSGLGALLGGGGGGGSSSSGLGLTDLLGGFSGGGSVSTGWAREANTGKLDNRVASSARAKRTEILGNGKDVFTIMIYMCGTDLESKSGMASNDLQEMAKANIGKNVNVLVYTGGCKGWKINGISKDVNQIYKVETGKLIPLEKAFGVNNGKSTMVDPENLTRFIGYCNEHYKANRRALIFWDHGGGSISGYGYDEKYADKGTMDLAEINSALAKANTTFDFIGFDACLMATLETGLMLDNYADYLIASEETEPGIGWYYTPWLNALSEGKNTSMKTIEIGKNIVDSFVDECNKRCAGQKTTLSVVDLAELSATVPAELKAFSTATSKLISGKDFKVVSDARSSTREFATSSKIDQVDLVHLCINMNTKESNALASALLNAVKYNKTSSSISNSYGISIYFPYQRTNYVNTAVKINKSIGLDSEYSRCIQQFATLEHGGQNASSSAGLSGGLDIGSLLGGLSSGGGGGLDIGSALGGLLGGREIDLDAAMAEQTLTENYFDASKLVWTTENGMKVMRLPKEQWEQVHELELNVFVEKEDGGYMNLGMDSTYSFTQDGALVGTYDRTWLGYGDTLVMFNYEDTLVENGVMTLHGNVPVLLNGQNAQLLVAMRYAYPSGEELDITVTGVRYLYEDPDKRQEIGENGAPYAVAKDAELAAAGKDEETGFAIDDETGALQPVEAELRTADEITFLCDHYDKNGEYAGTYAIADPKNPEQPLKVTYNGNLELSYKEIVESRKVVATYCFTDIYNNQHWTAPMN